MTRAAGWSQRRAFVGTTLAIATAFAVVLALTDRPRPSRPATAGRDRRAAFAVRDFVPPFQQWGTRAFTVPTLQSAYGRIDYLTLRAPGDDAKAEFLTRLAALLDAAAEVDLFLLAHTNEFAEWTATLDATRRARIRLVYDTGCFDLRQRDAWLALGAEAFVGHVGNSASSIFYVPFLRAWVRGAALADVVRESNEFTERLLHRVCAIASADPTPLVAATRAELAGLAQLTITGGMQ